jgi:V-type H+-transporting ATPase subunit C
VLLNIFADNSDGLYGNKEEIDDGEDFFPFVYIPAVTF